MSRRSLAENSHCSTQDIYAYGDAIMLKTLENKSTDECEDACRATAGCKVFSVYTQEDAGKCELYQKCGVFYGYYAGLKNYALVGSAP